LVIATYFVCGTMALFLYALLLQLIFYLTDKQITQLHTFPSVWLF